MKTIEDEVNNLYAFVDEELDKVKIEKFNTAYTVSIGDFEKGLSFSVDKTNVFPCITYYDITRIKGFQTHKRYERFSKTIKKIYQILEKEYIKRQFKDDDDMFRNYIKNIIEYNEEDEDFDFGEPMHTENLPECSLEVGKTYLVPLCLISKERRFDGGRGTEYYKFNYRTKDYGYRPFSIIDYHMCKDIQPFEKNK